MYANSIVYVSVIMAIFNTYFGLLFRFASYCYAFRRLNAFKRRVEVNVSNQALMTHGFRRLREKVIANRRAQSIVFSGANYQFMVLNEANRKRRPK